MSRFGRVTTRAHGCRRRRRNIAQRARRPLVCFAFLLGALTLVQQARGGGEPQLAEVRSRFGRVEHLADLAQERVRRERFLKERHAGLQHAMVDDRVVGVALGEEQLHLRPLGHELLGEPASAHARHHDVGQQELNFGRKIVGNQQCFAAVRGCQHLVAVPA